MKAIVRRSGFTYPLILVAMVIMAALPTMGVEIYWILVIFLFFVYLALANMWNLIAGYSGLISLGQPAFIGIAGYTLGVIVLAEISPLVGIVVGGIVAAAFALVISIPTFRMKGIYFAIGTWVVAEALRIFFNSYRPQEASAATWGGAGIPIKAAAEFSTEQIYYMAVIVGFASIFVTSFVLKSKLGLGLMAIRDSEGAASSCGVDVFRAKLYSFVISAFITGVAGCVFYLFQGHIEPVSAFGATWTILIVTAVIIGGIGTLGGPIVGAAIAVILQQTLARFVGVNLVIQGIILVAIISFAPKGIVGTIASAGWRNRLRGLRHPSNTSNVTFSKKT